MTIGFEDLYSIIGEFFVRTKMAESRVKHLEEQLALAYEENRISMKFIMEKNLKEEYEDYSIANKDPEFY